MARVASFAFFILIVAYLFPAKALGQGETTSAIVGEVKDATNAVVPGANVNDHQSRDRSEAKCAYRCQAAASTSPS